MTEIATSEDHVTRKGFLMHMVLRVLADNGGHVPRGDVLREIENRVDLTPWELERVGKHKKPRWQGQVTWGSTDLNVAGWINKTHDGWVVTPSGVETIERFPDGDGLDSEANRLYRIHYEERQRRDAFKERGYEIVQAALSLLEPGQWTTYTELAELSGVSPQNVGKFINAVGPDGGHRALLIDGRCGSDFEWAEPRPETQREVLEAEQLTFDSANRADEQAHVRTEDLREVLEDVGVLVALPRRAWLVRGSSVNGLDLVPVWLERGSISLAASRLRPVEPGLSRDDLKPIVDEDYGHTSYAAKAEKLDEFHAFVTKMQVDDVVATTSQGKLYVGHITGPATYQVSDDGRSNLRRNVEWADREGIDYADLPSDVAAKLQSQRDVSDLTQQLDTLEAYLRIETVPVPALVAEVSLPPASADLAEDLFVDRAWLQECIDLLERPATADLLRAARHGEDLHRPESRRASWPATTCDWSSSTRRTRTRTSSRAYRPVRLRVGFELRPGPLRRIVDQAKANPTVAVRPDHRRDQPRQPGQDLRRALLPAWSTATSNVDLLYATGDDEGFTLPKQRVHHRHDEHRRPLDRTRGRGHAPTVRVPAAASVGAADERDPPRWLKRRGTPGARSPICSTSSTAASTTPTSRSGRRTSCDPRCIDDRGLDRCGGRRSCRCWRSTTTARAQRRGQAVWSAAPFRG